MFIGLGMGVGVGGGANEDPNIYNMTQGLADYKSALSNGKASIIILGDSIGAGLYTTNPLTDSWAGLLKTQLNSLYGDAGYYICGGDLTEKNLWTLGAGWNYQLMNATPYGWRGQFSASAGSGTLSITLPGIGYDFYTLRGGSTQVHTVQVDAELPINIGANSAVQVWEKKSISGLTAGNHNIVYMVGSGLAFEGGIMVNLSDTGVVLDNASVSGAKSDFAISPIYKSDHRGVVSYDLTVMPMSVNDYLNQVALATYESNLTIAVAAVRSYGSVLLIAENIPQSSLTIPWSSYVEKMKAVAVAYDCAFLDIGGILGDYSVWSANGWMYDTVHPNDAGHAQYYNEIIKYLTL